LQFFVDRLAHLFEFGRVVGLERMQALIDHAADGFKLLLRFFAGAGELQRDGGPERFGSLFALGGETLYTGGDFFAEGAALLALALLGAGKFVAKAGFGSFLCPDACQKQDVENDQRGKQNKHNCVKHFNDAPFYCTKMVGRHYSLRTASSICFASAG
jgi:hypothetical protein